MRCFERLNTCPEVFKDAVRSDVPMDTLPACRLTLASENQDADLDVRTDNTDLGSSSLLF